MATGKGKVPNRGKKSGGGASAKKAPIVGYGQHGKAFYNIEKYHQSKSGRAHAAAAKAGHPLSTKPVGYGENGKAFFNPAKYANSKVGPRPGVEHERHGGRPTVNQQPHTSPSAAAHYSVAEVSKPTPRATTHPAMAPKTIRAPRMK
jgi:hypothetical protein